MSSYYLFLAISIYTLIKRHIKDNMQIKEIQRNFALEDVDLC